jgi:hypothetical protein
MQLLGLAFHLKAVIEVSMKTKLNFLCSIAVIALMTFTFNGCRDKIYEELSYTANVPVYMEFSEFRSSVKRTAPKQLEHPGKIYFKDNYLYINENSEGVHVIDNSDPTSPVNINFIEIPGNIDIAIRGNTLYADSFIDLVAIDISDPNNPVEISRLNDAFPNVLPAVDISLPVYGLDFRKGVVVGWEKKDITEMVEKGSGYRGDRFYFDEIGAPQLGSGDVSIIGGSTGIGGSMARFTIISDYMYAVHNNALKVFNIVASQGITKSGEVDLQRVVETIYPFQGRLFLGTTTGMLVYGLSNPALPNFISVFEHINSCDPVVVEGNIAYVTLRSGNACNGFVNQLDVIDISSIENPFLIKSYPLFNPHGLGIDNGILFICDGDAGLKVYDVTDPLQIHLHQLAHFSDIKTYDVIPYNDVLMLIGADGLFQYNYSDPTNLILLSQILVVNP